MIGDIKRCFMHQNEEEEKCPYLFDSMKGWHGEKVFEMMNDVMELV